MKLKKILAGLVATSMTASLMITAAGADGIKTFDLFSDYYTGSFTVTGSIDAGDVPFELGDIIWLGASNVPYQQLTTASSDLTSGDFSGTSTGFVAATGTPKLSQTSRTTYVYSPGGTQPVTFHGIIDGDEVKLTDDTKYAETIWNNAFTVSKITINNVQPQVVSSSGYANPLIKTTSGTGLVAWETGITSDEYGRLALKEKVGTLTYQITFSLNPDATKAQEIAKKLKNLTSEEKTTVGSANAINLVWEKASTTFSSGSAVQAIILQPKASVIDLGGITNKMQPKTGETGAALSDGKKRAAVGNTGTQINLVQGLTSTQVSELGKAAAAGKNIEAVYTFETAVRTNSGIIDFGYAPFVGVESGGERIQKSVEKGATEAVLTIKANDAWNPYTGIVQWLYYVPENSYEIKDGTEGNDEGITTPGTWGGGSEKDNWIRVKSVTLRVADGSTTTKPSASDAAAALRISLRTATADEIAKYDYDKDGAVKAADAIALLKASLA